MQDDLPFPDSPVNSIDFHAEATDPQLGDEELLKAWIRKVINKEGGKLHFINYIFCTDEYLHQINLTYLEHDTYTDIITFPYSDTALESDIFISVERIAENAKTFGVSYQDELHRVMIHGVLHLLGFGDKSEEEKNQMRQKEEECMKLL